MTDGQRDGLGAEIPGWREVMDRLAKAEAAYRHSHDCYGGGDIRTGRAWDRMRHAGDEARSYVATAVTLSHAGEPELREAEVLDQVAEMMGRVRGQLA